jgi:hypothetical protein
MRSLPQQEMQRSRSRATSRAKRMEMTKKMLTRRRRRCPTVQEVYILKVVVALRSRHLRMMARSRIHVLTVVEHSLKMNSKVVNVGGA